MKTIAHKQVNIWLRLEALFRPNGMDTRRKVRKVLEKSDPQKWLHYGNTQLCATTGKCQLYANTRNRKQQVVIATKYDNKIDPRNLNKLV
jgi:hypothetical protein